MAAVFELTESSSAGVVQQALELRRGLRSWLASEAVRSPDGAFVGWVDADTGRRSFEYPEINGYALTYLAALSELSDQEAGVGRRAGEWLLSRVKSGKAAPHDRYGAGLQYNFDLAMISAGLQSFGARIGNDEFVEQGLEIAGDLVGQIRGRGGLNCLTPSSGATTRSAWSTVGYAHLTKVTQCLLLADRNGLPGALEAAAAVVANGLPFQLPDGRWVTHPEDRETMLHPHLYAFEGLWMYAQATGDPAAYARSVSAVGWAYGQQVESGALPRYARVGSAAAAAAGPPEQSDATAQGVRAAALVGMDGAGYQQALRWLCSAAVLTGEGCAIPYQPSTADRHLNVWAGFFAYQATERAAGRQLEWPELV